MDVSVILVNYNTLELTRKAIESIYKHTGGVDFEVILVDNASTDGSKDYFRGRKDIIYIYNETNVGFGKANNIGYRYAKGKYIFLLNTDTYLLNNAIKCFFDYMEKAPADIACAGCWLKNMELEDNQSEVHFLSISTVLKNSMKAFVPSFVRRRGQNQSGNEKSDEKQVEAVIGADMFVRRDVIEKWGLFDENIFMYCEEIDVQKRWTDAGYKMMLISSPSIVHLEGQSSNRYSAKRNIMFTKGVFYYLKKHNPAWKYQIFRVLYAILKLPFFLNRHYTFHDRCMIIRNIFTFIPHTSKH